MQYVYVLNKHGEPLMPCSPRKQPISKSWSPNLCPHCDADLGGDCNDGYYQNPHYERCPVCGQKLKYI